MRQQAEMLQYEVCVTHAGMCLDMWTRILHMYTYIHLSLCIIYYVTEAQCLCLALSYAATADPWCVTRCIPTVYGCSQLSAVPYIYNWWDNVLYLIWMYFSYCQNFSFLDSWVLVEVNWCQLSVTFNRTCTNIFSLVLPTILVHGN